ncbi:MAG: ABC transporter permease subunit [Coriobacteriales bacterium]|nr:ABC transporter permease subunit [Coriobacteriales bacterium]
MGTLVKFELKKLLGNKAGMAACALMLAMLAAVAILNLATMDSIDLKTGTYVSGPKAQETHRAMQESHAGTLDDERIAVDVASFDRANRLLQEKPDLYDLSGQEIIKRYGLRFWQETRGVVEQGYYMEIIGTLDSANPRATSLRDGFQARFEGALENGFWGYHHYTDSEKTYWRDLANKISWPVQYGYDGGWHYVLSWRGGLGLAIVALCIALSGIFAGEYQSHTGAVVLPTRCGKRELPIAKALAALAFTSAYWCVLIVFIVAFHVLIYGADGWDLPVQVAIGFDNPYPLTIGQAILASYALGYLVALGMASLTMFLSARMRSAMPVAATAMAVIFLGIVTLFSTPLAKLALLTPFSGLSYAFDAMVSYVVGPVVIGLPTMLAMLYVAMLVVFVPLAMSLFRRHQA